jgi:hypothetical protein
MVDNQFPEIVHFFITRVAPSNTTLAQKKQQMVKEKYYQLIIGNLYNLGVDGIL